MISLNRTMILFAAPLLTSVLSAGLAVAMVGGATPDAALAPRVVAIMGTNGSVCTGSVIALDLVLTAAHCVEPGFKYAAIELSHARLRETEVARVEQHPQFHFNASNKARPTDDIAILKLAKQLSASAVPVPLGSRDFFPAGDRFSVAGLGSDSEHHDGKFGRLLVAGLVTVISRSDLQLRLIDPLTRGDRPGSSACTGDSGGPVFEDTWSGPVLVGVVSWAATVSGNPGCGGLTGATPIAPVRQWIDETARLLGSFLGTQPIATRACCDIVLLGALEGSANERSRFKRSCRAS